MSSITLPFRQVHLDFHTSPHIPEVGLDFDPQEFVRTLQAGHVNSVTVFAKCHHGYSYYPTQVGTPHPHLRRDLLGEMIDACHEAGIRVPVYTTVVWDELAWATHPEWRQVSPQGGVVGPSTSPLQPGWKNLCMNTGYADYVIDQIREILANYDGDGLFIDIVRYGTTPCVCATCLQQIVGRGLDPEDPKQLQRFALGVERRFMARTTQAIRAIKPEQSIFYNSRLRMELDPELGNRPEMEDFTHLEIESLPGGFWGYDHFPMYVRYFQCFDRELVTMTGRFHTAWGDFGGLRNRHALAFECFQGLAHGTTCSIGDQLHPRGRLDPAVYRRIGEVYAEVEQREPWCVAGDLSPYAVVVLPDQVPLDDRLADRLRAYLNQGGKLLITDRSGLDSQALQGKGGDFCLAGEMGVHYVGPAPFAPDYLALEPEFAADQPGPAEIEPMYHVCLMQGSQVTVEPGVKVLARSGVPYFNRTWRHFCSHQYTPMERISEDPLIVQNGNIIYVARPLFREYADSSRLVHRRILANCLRRLLPRPRVGAHNLPSTAVVTVRRQGHDLIVHLLHYVHQRRGKTLDIIEDLLPLHDVTVSVRAESEPQAVRLVPEQEPVAWTWTEGPEGGYVRFIVPRIAGYQIVQLVGAAS
jgi:hypothetical protein